MKFACPHCQQHLEADDSFAGATVDCPACGKELVIGASQPAEPPPPEAQPAPPQPQTSPEPEQEPDETPATEIPPPPPPEPPKAAPKFRVVSRPESAKPAAATPKFRVVSHPDARETETGTKTLGAAAGTSIEDKVRKSASTLHNKFIFSITSLVKGWSRLNPNSVRTAFETVRHKVRDTQRMMGGLFMEQNAVHAQHDLRGGDGRQSQNSGEEIMNNTDTTIRITCPHCRVVLETDDPIDGARVNCPECGKAFVAHPSPGKFGKVPPFRVPKKRWIGWGLAVLAVFFLLSMCSGKRNVDDIRSEIIQGYNKELSNPRSALRQRIERAHLTVSVKSAHVVRCDITTLDGSNSVGKNDENIQTVSLLLRFEWQGWVESGYTDLRIVYDAVNERLLDAGIEYTTAFVNLEDPELWNALGFAIGSML